MIPKLIPIDQNINPMENIKFESKYPCKCWTSLKKQKH